MLNKLENSRLRSSTAKAGRVVAACVICAGILSGTALAVTSAPQTAGFGNLVAPGRAELPNVQTVGWRRGGGGPGMLHRMSDDDIKERLTRVVRHVAIEIDATPEQQTEIVSIVTPVALGMKENHREFASVSEDLRALLLAQEIDRVAIEALRAEKLAVADEISKTLTAMIVDVAAVLTPEQRAQLDERIEEFRAMGRRFRHR
ncbi:Spy/CpxP family protein refolding chaperone [Roseibium album]|uniref:P pilus assembly/Cpx signaling pathway, periplasmic inhibitor/zinc-resistance associated protein n=1 Tax=Roseibium album TaxID=311410 RepID=A0A0M7A313_9HYPH|nr:Spy/CpxP family protein refolding chaperone [Roseibium album]MBG6154294.1 Spy/CpxP family protein refolding chaperone [Labrenzia sp. EL_162]MBG6193577.1 Spy/CpxP family protein refolding chaperone [Labrenzia sp. EL_159]MBG6199947.1 Spy/CpxP family protein refolding chaperone [Labrenzia sp. EL_13]MCR9058541.1 Spy/CpxP family protein refolding chaperone [Paracoccaceae bacterium]CTQ61362.1 P pilus assembly/Cpx signaling pathway, periplasmic inhibitor/zinc-resistance associated protein [Roseibi